MDAFEISKEQLTNYDRDGYIIVRKFFSAVQMLLGEECYHWHSKFVIKPPKCNSLVVWHQDFGSLYDDGLMYPNMLTVSIAITQTTKKWLHAHYS